MADRDPTKYYVRFKRLSIPSECTLCATPIKTGVKASLRYPRRGDVRPWLYLCDDCAEAFGEHAWSPEEPMMDRPVGGMCCVGPVDGGCR